MRIMLVGLGSIGQRHFNNIRALLPQSVVAVLSSHHSGAGADMLGVVQGFDALESALAWKPDATIIANPAPLHIKTAHAFAGIGSHLFIEKPLSIDLAGVDDLMAACTGKERVLMVGYMLRFSDPIIRMKDAIVAGRIGAVLSVNVSVGQNLLTWRPGRDYKETVSAHADRGGGVLLELSHEFDAVRWLAGEVRTVFAQAATVSDLDIDVEDTADMLLTFASGAFGSIHLDMLDWAGHRRYRIIGTHGTLEWQSAEGDRVRLFTKEDPAGIDLRPSSPLDRNAMYCAELEHFFECIQHHHEPLISGEDGKRALELVLAAKQSAQSGCSVTV